MLRRLFSFLGKKPSPLIPKTVNIIATAVDGQSGVLKTASKSLTTKQRKEAVFLARFVGLKEQR